MKTGLKLIPALLFLTPLVAFADTEQTIVQIANVFNVFTGFMFVAACLLFGGGFIVWLARLGTAPRTDGIHIMQWSVAVLFVLDVLLGVVEYVERHSQNALYIVAFIIIVLIIWAVIASGLLGGGKSEEKEH